MAQRYLGLAIKPNLIVCIPLVVSQHLHARSTHLAAQPQLQLPVYATASPNITVNLYTELQTGRRDLEKTQKQQPQHTHHRPAQASRASSANTTTNELHPLSSRCAAAIVPRVQQTCRLAQLIALGAGGQVSHSSPPANSPSFRPESRTNTHGVNSIIGQLAVA